MKRLPGRNKVSRAFQSTVREVKGVLQQVNQQAGKLVARGSYSGAEALVGRGKQVQAFRKEVEALLKKWRALSTGGGGVAAGVPRNEKTPLWSYYRPVLQALESLGGDSTTDAITTAAEPLLKPVLKEGDDEPMAGSRLRWQVMVRRCKPALTKEGFLETGTGVRWKITATGRRAARAKPEKE